MKELFRKKEIKTILREVEEGSGDEGHKMNKVLGVKDLTFFGIAAIIGAGIFSSIGKACYDGGPAVILLYIFTAIACGFAALCYAEFASTVPVSGSAYTYAYVAFGELFAWVIGWDLLMEYAIGNIAVAISWSDYFTHLLSQAGIHIPTWMTMDYHTAHLGYLEAERLMDSGKALSAIDSSLQEKFLTWNNAPMLGSLRMIFNLPAFMIVALLTAVVFVGIQESRKMSNAMVIFKLGVIFLIVVVGGYYVQPENWSPFAPNGMAGVLKGVSAVFFAYIGFDAISTTAEECKNPQRDLPRGMIYALIICTILYVILALVLTGMLPYTQLNVGDPLAIIFEQRGMPWMAGIVAVSAIIATAGVLLVFQMGQPRIWMSMSRDGLLPKIFSRLHPRYKTPSFSTILTGVIVGVSAMFLNLDVVISLTSIGTLFAFVLVCAGVLVLQQLPDRPSGKFSVPYINARYWTPAILLLSVILTFIYVPEHFSSLFTIDSWPMLLFWIAAILITILSISKSYSLIPVLGFTSCFYLMAQESHTNWLRFLIWLLVGLIIYFAYSKKHSRLSGK